MTIGTGTQIKPILWDISQQIFGADKQKQQIYRNVVDAWGRETRGCQVLEFGCATGGAAMAFSDCSYTGIDIDAALIHRAAEKYREYPGLSFVAGDIFNITWPNDGFDKVLFAGTAHHLDDHLIRRVLLQLRRSLRNGGAIYFVDPVKTGKEGLLLKRLMAADQGKHHRALDEYKGMFEELNFKIHQVSTVQPKGTLFPQPLYGTIIAS